MKTTACGYFWSFFAAISFLADDAAAVDLVPTFNSCREIGDFAEAVMVKRQDQARMSDVMDLALAASPTDRKNDVRSLIILAYEEIAYGADENRTRAIREFRNKVELSCYSTE